MAAPWLSRPTVARAIVDLALRLHNWSYRTAGLFSRHLEPDRLHPKHRLTGYHRWFADRLQADWRVLDIGCGHGALAHDLRESCAAVVGVDISPRNIETARSRYAREGVLYRCADATRESFREHFDAIILSNVLEHIEDRVGFLTSVYAQQDQAEPPVLLLRVPEFTRDWITPYKKERGIEWRLDSTHFTEYSEESLLEELRLAGLAAETLQARYGELFAVVRRVRQPRPGDGRTHA